MSVNTKVPQGSTPGEKIFNLAQSVFPELQKKIGKTEKLKGKITLNYISKGKKARYEFDCYQSAYNEKGEPSELFIAKYFHDELVTFETIQELCDRAKYSRETKEVNKRIEDAKYEEIFLLICVSDNYSKEILEDKNNYLEKMMDELDFDDNIDLIQETKEGNFKIIWIDYE